MTGNDQVISTAIIMAAGRGVRLGPLGTEIPKGFIEFEGTPLVLRSLHQLHRLGVRRVRIVTGHLREFYESLSAPEGMILECMFNPHFADMGSGESMRLGLEGVEEPVFLLESDIVYEDRALALLADCQHENVILVSGPTGMGDEVHVWTVPDTDLFTSMSKDRNKRAEQPLGEFVGINKLSRQCCEVLSRGAGKLQADNPMSEYESCLVAATASIDLNCLKVRDLVWAEIDDTDMLARAQSEVFPRLK